MILTDKGGIPRMKLIFTDIMTTNHYQLEEIKSIMKTVDIELG